MLATSFTPWKMPRRGRSRPKPGMAAQGEQAVEQGEQGQQQEQLGIRAGPAMAISARLSDALGSQISA